MDIQDKRKEIEEKIEFYQEKLKNLDLILKEIPDLITSKDRWGNDYYSAESVNTRVTGAWMNHNCGCCDDSPLQIWPYIMVEGKRVHSSPKYFTIGEKCSNCCNDKQYDGWREELKGAGIPDAIIQIAEKHFQEDGCDDRCWEDDDDDS